MSTSASSKLSLSVKNALPRYRRVLGATVKRNGQVEETHNETHRLDQIWELLVETRVCCNLRSKRLEFYRKDNPASKHEEDKRHSLRDGGLLHLRSDCKVACIYIATEERGKCPQRTATNPQ